VFQAARERGLRARFHRAAVLAHRGVDRCLIDRTALAETVLVSETGVVSKLDRHNATACRLDNSSRRRTCRSSGAITTEFAHRANVKRGVRTLDRCSWARRGRGRRACTRWLRDAMWLAVLFRARCNDDEDEDWAHPRYPKSVATGRAVFEHARVLASCRS
jgi:hypothetical protein